MPLYGQEFRAAVAGTVTDQQGAVIPGVAIEARNLATNSTYATTTNETGSYVVPFVPIGVYTVTASTDGFKTGIRERLELRVGDRLRVDFVMELGAVVEQVTVSAEGELLESTNASNGQVIDSKSVADLPLLGRNPFMLAQLATGVQRTSALASRSNRPFDNGGMDNWSINGSRSQTNEFLLDGVPDTNTETSAPSNLSFVPSPDATQEFKVQTNTYDAQYGRTGGGVINVSLKSGTNDFHGSVYHYYRNDKLNANDFASNAAGNEKGQFNWNQPGVQVDGPVILPGYNGRNKTFFMYSWEKIKSAIPFPQTYTVPTEDQRGGNFATTQQANGNPITVYDPLTTAGAGGNYTREAFPNNMIPQDRWDPVSRNLLSYIPTPTDPGNAAGFFNLVVSGNPRTDEYDQHIIRIDQVITDKHRFFSRYVRGNRHELNSDAGFQHAATPWYGHWRINQGGNFDLTSMLSPTLVLNSRVGYIRHQFAIQQYGEGFDPVELGFPADQVNQLPKKFFPRILYTDYTAFGPQRNTGSQFTFSDTWSWAETLNKVSGNHSLKFGTEFRVTYNNQDNPTSSFARFDFNKEFTQRDPQQGDSGSGNAFASLLLGVPESGSNDFRDPPAYSNRYFVLFFQDDWRVTKNFTLNLGLRWDYNSPQSERYNRQNRGFDASASNPFEAPGLDLRGGLLFADADNRLPFQRDLNNFQPRIGVAYQVAPKTVIRSGYGLSYLPTFDTGNNNGFSVMTPYVASIDGGITPAGQLSNPFPDGYLTPPGRSQGLATLLGTGFTYSWPNRVIPYVHQFSFGVQHELPWRLLIDASYVGSRTKGLQATKGINEVSAEQLALGSGVLRQNVPNPFEGLLPGTSLNGPTVTQEQLMRPFPQFLGINEQDRSVGYMTYNSFQLRVEKRMSAGLSFLVSYTLAKSIEAVSYLNPQQAIGDLDSVLTRVDAPHRLMFSSTYELPFFNNASGLKRTLLGGWQLNGIATFQSGAAVRTPGGALSSGTSAALPSGQQSRDRWMNTCTVRTNGARQNCASDSEPVAFLQQPPFTLTTLSTVFPDIRLARPAILDLSLFKAFAINERVRAEFRLESFNAFNTPFFGEPNRSLNSSNFGVVSNAQQNDPRNFQLGVRLRF
jgi:hypothetical protein